MSAAGRTETAFAELFGEARGRDPEAERQRRRCAQQLERLFELLPQLGTVEALALQSSAEVYRQANQGAHHRAWNAAGETGRDDQELTAEMLAVRERAEGVARRSVRALLTTVLNEVCVALVFGPHLAEEHRDVLCAPWQQFVAKRFGEAGD